MIKKEYNKPKAKIVYFDNTEGNQLLAGSPPDIDGKYYDDGPLEKGEEDDGY